MGIIEKYGTALMAVLLGGGFAFGGMAAYSGMIQTGSSGGGQQPNLTAPGQNYIEGPINRTTQEKVYISSQNDIVFVTAYYRNSSEQERLGDLESLAGQFNDRLYINTVNASDSRPPGQINTYPGALVVGAGTQRQAFMVQNANPDRIRQSACDAYRTLGDLAAVCVG